MLHVRLLLAACVAAVLSFSGFSGVSANGATEAGSGYEQCPESPQGAGPVFKNDLGVDDLLVGYYVEDYQVLKSADAKIVCVSSLIGYTDVSADRRGVFYASSGQIGTDTVRVGAVIDSTYYTTEFAVSSVAPGLTKPLVTKKLAQHSKAAVKYTNTSAYTLLVRAGSFKQLEPDVMRWVAPGSSFVIKTKRPKLDYDVAVELGSKKSPSPIGMAMGSANTRTGKVTMIKFWSTDVADDGAAARATAGAASPWRR